MGIERLARNQYQVRSMPGLRERRSGQRLPRRAAVHGGKDPGCAGVDLGTAHRIVHRGVENGHRRGQSAQRGDRAHLAGGAAQARATFGTLGEATARNADGAAATLSTGGQTGAASGPAGRETGATPKHAGGKASAATDPAGSEASEAPGARFSGCRRSPRRWIRGGESVVVRARGYR